MEAMGDKKGSIESPLSLESDVRPYPRQAGFIAPRFLSLRGGEDIIVMVRLWQHEDERVERSKLNYVHAQRVGATNGEQAIKETNEVTRLYGYAFVPALL